MPGSAAWDESLHPRATDGKFGQGSGGGAKKKTRLTPEQRKAAAAEKAAARVAAAATKAKERTVARMAKAHARAGDIMETAKLRAQIAHTKGHIDAAKHEARLNAGRVKAKDVEKVKAKIVEARAKAKAKADDIVAKAKERAHAAIEKAKAGPPRKVKAKPAPPQATAPQSPAKQPDKPTPAADPRAALAEHAKASAHDAFVKTNQLLEHEALAKDAVDDTDFQKAEDHAQHVNRLRAEIADHVSAATKAAEAHGGNELKNHVNDMVGGSVFQDDNYGTHVNEIADMSARSVEATLRFGKQDHKYTPREAPEAGAMGATAYRKMSEAYPRKLSPHEKVAVANYSDHADKILNPILRASQGKPDEQEKLYEGPRVPDHVHAERLEKRRSRIDEAKDYAPTVGNEIRNLDSAIAKHTFESDAKVYRVVKDPGGKLFGSLKPGQIMQDHGYMSVTADKNVLSKFYDGDRGARIDFHVTVKKGQAGAPIAELSSFKREREILLPRGSKFRVTKVEPSPDGSYKQIHVEVV